MLPERESRPATNGPAPEISTPIKTTVTVTASRRVCAGADHDCRWPCPLHGCPDCSVVELQYVDPLDYEPPVPRDTPMWELLAVDLYEVYVDETGCLICLEILRRNGWAEFPGWECEATCDVHCSVCGLCMRSGKVCRVCGVCVEHQEDGDGSCEYSRWDRFTSSYVAFWAHELRDPKTGRWKR